ncbi:MAG TPA: four helix bundle protein [Thermoanaerobaculia bacterium]|jgi:four helix bundle protein
MPEATARHRKVRTFEDLEVWKLARHLTQSVYEVSARGDFARDGPLRSQIRRAAISVMSNIAEGFERDGNREFQQFLALSKASSGEVRSHLYAALDQRYLSQESFERIAASALRTSRMISSLIKYLRTSEITGRKFKPPET